MKRQTCKELCLFVFNENPVTQFAASDMERVLDVKHDRCFHVDTIAKAFRELFKAGECESLINPHGSDTFAKEFRQSTPEERAKQKAHHAAWQIHLKVEYEKQGFGTPHHNLTGPPALLPEDFKKEER